MATLIQFKRSSTNLWNQGNPVLKMGEPGFEVDTGKLKIGDGSTPWRDLPYTGENISVINANSHTEFPNIGKANCIYKAEKEQKVYQWNTEKLAYEVIGNLSDPFDIKLINGGSANG